MPLKERKRDSTIGTEFWVEIVVKEVLNRDLTEIWIGVDPCLRRRI